MAPAIVIRHLCRGRLRHRRARAAGPITTPSTRLARPPSSPRLPTGVQLRHVDGKVDFDQEFGSQVRTNVLWLYSLTWLGEWLNHYENTNDPWSLKQATATVRHYLAYVSTQHGRTSVNRNRGLGAVNHAFAVRATTLLRLLRLQRAPECRNPDAGLLLPMAREIWACAEWLSRDSSRTPDNHGVMVDLALFEVGVTLDHPNAYTSIAVARLTSEAERLFEPSGYCRENSAPYHRFNLQLHDKALALFAKVLPADDSALIRLRSICDRARAVLPQIVRADGTLPPIGDGVYTAFVAPSEPKQGSIFRSPHFAVAKCNGSYLSLVCGSSLPFHKHVDDLSLTWRHLDLDILIDGGSFNYDREDPIRQCLESSLGHSSASLAPMAKCTGRAWTRLATAGQIASFSTDRSGLEAQASVSVPAWDSHMVRRIAWTGDSLSVTDTVYYGNAAVPETRYLCQQWLTGPNLRLLDRQDSLGQVRIELGYDSHRVVFTLAARGEEVQVHHGHVGPDGTDRYGWYSPGRDQVQPTLAIRVCRHTSGTRDELAAKIDVLPTADNTLARREAGRSSVSYSLPATSTMRISLSCSGNNIKAHIDDEAGGDAQYAVYLFRDGKRIATRPYDTRRSATFTDQLDSGNYTAKAFKRNTAGSTTSCHSSPLVVASGHPSPTVLAKHEGHPDPVSVASVDALPRHIEPAKVQRLDIREGALTYCVFKGKARGKRLFVVLAGAIDRDRVAIPRFSRHSWRDEFPGTFLCIADPTLALDPRLRLSWYFGRPEQDAIEGVCRIVEAVRERLGLALEDVCFYGSSGGGFAALLAAARMGHGATAIAINPQVNVLEYPSTRFVDAFLTKVLGGLDKTRAMALHAPRLSALRAWEMPDATGARCLLVQNRVDAEHFHGHFRVFAAAHGVPDNGHSADRRMASIVYDHPSGHSAEPRDMLPRILATALDLATPPRAGNQTADGAAPIRRGKANMSLLERIAAIKPRQDFLNHTYISLRHGYVYAAVGKAANSTVKHHLYEHEYGSTRFKTKSLHDRQSSPLLSPFQLPPELLAEVLQSPKFCRFTVVRNPYSRILSCYLDRIVPANTQPYRHLMAALGRSVGEAVSFDEFVRTICKQRPYDQNNHWRLQVAEVCYGEIQYDEVGKQESFATDMARIWKRISRGSPMPNFAAENKAPSITSAERRLAEFYDSALIELIRVAYAADFETFGYSKDPHQR